MGKTEWNRKAAGSLLAGALLLAGIGQTAGAAPLLKDVEGSYASQEIRVLADNGILSGYENGLFHPANSVTRAELAKMIATVMEYEENEEAAIVFKDIQPDAWYKGYVGALVDNGITEGTSPDAFSPNEPVSREQLTVLIIRAMNVGNGGGQKADQPPFVDESSVSSWAAESVALAAEIGLVDGDDQNRFLPKKHAERQAAAKLIYGLGQFYGKFGGDLGEGNPSTSPGGGTPTDPSQGPGTGVPGDNQGPQLLSGSVVISGSTYNAVSKGNGQFIFTLPTGLTDKDKLTGFHLKASPDAAALSTEFMGESRTVSFTNGEANLTVADVLGSLDPQGDGVSMSKLNSLLGYSALHVTGTLKDTSGKETDVKLTVQLAR